MIDGRSSFALHFGPLALLLPHRADPVDGTDLVARAVHPEARRQVVAVQVLHPLGGVPASR